jgi:cysteinyl-tRNA synthetase
VDDKTIRQNQAEGKSLHDFTTEWTRRYHEDCAALNILPPHVEPGAVEHIQEQIDLIVRLVEGGHAYVAADGSVYFRVSSFPEYGRLSRLKEREITTDKPVTSGLAREDADEYTRDSAADFALWKARKPEDGPNFWPSPWGEGRPGWHIECSAMAMKHLGESFDLHSGGIDLVFPHHENEIAQSEAATGKVFARLWFHVQHLQVDGGKMSKSLGNLFTVEDVARKGVDPIELRYFLISGHYGKPLNFTWEALFGAQKAVARLRRFNDRLATAAGVQSFGEADPILPPEGSMDAPWSGVWKALQNDLNTAEALGAIFGTSLPAVETQLDQGVTPEVARRLWEGWRRVGFALGLKFAKKAEAEVPAKIQALAEERWAARSAKDWAKSDDLRRVLLEKGWEVKDSKTAYVLKPAVAEISAK